MGAKTPAHSGGNETTLVSFEPSLLPIRGLRCLLTFSHSCSLLFCTRRYKDVHKKRSTYFWTTATFLTFRDLDGLPNLKTVLQAHSVRTTMKSIICFPMPSRGIAMPRFLHGLMEGDGSCYMYSRSFMPGHQFCLSSSPLFLLTSLIPQYLRASGRPIM